MSQIKRRHFLQFAASTLATLGLSQFDIQRRGLRYAQVLAQNTPRKLALLVGINGYKKNLALQGCVSDVHLQRELLIHRFGFNPQDVLMVTDETSTQPTRTGILQAFEEHLINQAKPGDVVVFHFSGHGSQVFDPNSPTGTQRNSTFVPMDRTGTPLGSRQFAVSDIMGETLFLLMSKLNTENVTVVLDSCHSGGGTRGDQETQGNLKIRGVQGARDDNGNKVLQLFRNEEEKEYQARLQTELGWSDEELLRRRQAGIAKGIVISSARENQLAADAPFDGFHAGAFTYLMTQYLWQETGNQAVENVIPNVARSTTKVSMTQQIPDFESKPGSGNERKPMYFLNKQVPPAEAVIRAIQGNQVQFWLGGLYPEAFAAFNSNALFTLINNQGQPQGSVQLNSRNGLVGTGRVVEGQVQPGLFLQEKARSIPLDLRLRIGLDESLGGERNRAQTGLQGIERVEAVPLGQGMVHYIFGRMTSELSQELQQRRVKEIPPVNSVGLYAQGLEVIPGSFAAAGETVADALTRLRPKLRALLAARVIKVTLNADSSRLNVSSTMKVAGAGTFVAQVFTARGSENQALANQPSVAQRQISVENGIPSLPLGTFVQFEATNRENRDLYITVLVIDAEGEIAIVFPNNWTATDDATLVKAGETRIIPQQGSDPFQLQVSPPLGSVEVLVISSIRPLREALGALQTIAASQRGGSRGPVSISSQDSDPMAVVDTLLIDLAQNRGGATSSGNRGSSGNSSSGTSMTATNHVVDTNQIGSMSITFRVV